MEGTNFVPHLKYHRHDTVHEYKYESCVFKVSVMLTSNVRQGVLLKDPAYYLALTGVSQKTLFSIPTLAIRGRQLKKLSIGKLKSRDFDIKSLANPMIFHMTPIWSFPEASKSEAPKSTLLNKSCSNQKILADLLLKLLKLV